MDGRTEGSLIPLVLSLGVRALRLGERPKHCENNDDNNNDVVLCWRMTMVMRIMMMNMIDVLVTAVGSSLKMMVKMIPDDFNREWPPSQQGTSQRKRSSAICANLKLCSGLSNIFIHFCQSEIANELPVAR